jgi:hypothetical protein
MAAGEHRPGGQPGARTGPAAVELRVAGASFGDIANFLGLPDARMARQIVERELATHLTHDDIDIARAEASAMLDELRQGVWDKATDPEHAEHLPAVRMALALVDRFVRLHGLDRPSEVIIHSPTANEIERWVGEMLSMKNVDVIEADIIEDPEDVAALGPARH